jgi:hypothetical protein
MISAAVLQPLLDRLPGLESRLPHPTLPRRLDGLFRALKTEAEDHFETEDLIWAIWSDHPVPDHADRMEAATQAMAQRDFVSCRLLLDRLQMDVPDWAEVWNKSATLYFLIGQDDMALVDFGALAGFGEICLRHNEPDVARLAFQVALRMNPHLHGLAAKLASLQKSQLH